MIVIIRELSANHEYSVRFEGADAPRSVPKAVVAAIGSLQGIQHARSEGDGSVYVIFKRNPDVPALMVAIGKAVQQAMQRGVEVRRMP